MRKLRVGMTSAAFVMAIALPAFAKVETLKGKVVDEGCSMGEMAGHSMGEMEGHSGADHKPAMDMTACAIQCAKAGEPLALVTGDGKVYRITGGLAANKNKKLIAHVGHTVEITGDVSEKDGKVQVSANALKAVTE